MYATRRQLLVRAGAALVGGALVELTGACSTPHVSGGTLKILMWQAPTILNAHLATGMPSLIASRICCEPLLAASADGTLSPVLAAEVPSTVNGGLSADGRTVTYRLKRNVKWADGEPFTAEDVVFTYEFVANKDTAAPSLSAYLDLHMVEALDPYTVRLTFNAPTGGWFVPFTGSYGQIVPKHALQNYMGVNARNAPFNLKPIGTGPFVVEDFKPGDVALMTANPNYREPGKPFFNRLEIKGGGDAVSAARAVLQTGEYDYAVNLQVESQVLEQLKQGGKGDLVTAPGAGVEQIFLNMADPNSGSDGERPAPSSRHAFLVDERVREAMALAIDRASLAIQLYGVTGEATSNVLTTPTSLSSPNTRNEVNLDRANHILDDAGYTRGADGIRVTPGGVRMSLVLQAGTNSVRQKEQAVIKEAWHKIGVETELKTIDASVFSSSSSSTDSYKHFSADAELLATTFDSPFPLRYMKMLYSQDPARDWAQKSNDWVAPNFTKWSNAEFNRLYDVVSREFDAERARQLWIQLNDLAVNSHVTIPLVARKIVDARSNALRGPAPGPFDAGFAWNLADWTRV